ncbi:19581_t:CDS:2 [Dentiscutata erythropus]|uniref:19581_t:CDS:1 n=1 Tax=Dentiscutata erythropus TaxID=1348616 RepID=A0A9N9CAB7_9GLOM|nr:19581_t:CDS:2 [Dentiscutata erythropus]
MNTSNDILNNLPLSELHYNVNQLYTCQSSTSEQLLKPLQEQNEIGTSQEIDDSQNNSSDEENFQSNQPKKDAEGWMCAGILFETIDNPFIIDMLKTLNTKYNSLS